MHKLHINILDVGEIEHIRRMCINYGRINEEIGIPFADGLFAVFRFCGNLKNALLRIAGTGKSYVALEKRTEIISITVNRHIGNESIYTVDCCFAPASAYFLCTVEADILTGI